MTSAALTRVDTLVGHLTASSSSSSSTPPRVSITSTSNGVAVLTINYPPVNSLHPDVQSQLRSCYQTAIGDPDVKAIVITGTGASFVAGADVEVLHREQLSRSHSASHFSSLVRNMHDLYLQLENGPKPVVAAINGTCLGGGCEMAMSCSHRVASSSSQLGQPELKLGLIPGAGGCVRFPRLIGLEKAISLTTSGKAVKANEALKLGLVDVVVKSNSELIAAASKVALEVASGQRKRGNALKKSDKLPSIEESMDIIAKARAVSAKKNKNVPHFNAYFDCVSEGLKGGELGIKAEIEKFSELIMAPSAISLIHFFFASRGTTRIPGIPSKASGKIQRVAVIGAGTMGVGIAINLLTSGYEVILKEVNEAMMVAGIERLLDNIQRVIKARKLPPFALEAIMRPLKTTISYEGFDGVDLAIEAAVENLKIKQQIFAELEKVCPKHAVLATNTSTIDIEKISALTNAKDRIIGLHYFAPAHVMLLLEIIRTPHTSPNVIAQSLELAKRTKKVPVVVGNVVGFTANRMFFPYGQSASFLVDGGVDLYSIDKTLEKFGMPMGVFRMGDLSGLDILVHVGGIMAEAYGERCYQSTLAKKFVEKGRLGQKTGKGYYQYVKGQHKPDPSALTIIEAARADAKKAGVPSTVGVSESQIVEMLFFPAVNEALRILDEKHVNSLGDIDICSCLGYGFPTWRGGAAFWAQQGASGQGWKYVRDRLAAFSSNYGSNAPKLKSFYAPCELLNKLADGKAKAK